MRKSQFIIIVLISALQWISCGNSIVAQVLTDTTIISRNIDASKTVGKFPNLTAYWNTSVQKVPAPVIGDLAKEEFGKAKIIRCWLNLDEMWDYRDRQFTFDFKMGVDKYKDIPEKYRESWSWQEESPSTFYQYMDAFSRSCDEVMLVIRRYERDILDKKLPISMADWKMILKMGVEHYKKRYPNLRYVDIGNEYPAKSFMSGTDEEYYQFYKLGYEAVNEINDELDLKGDEKILIGGPDAWLSQIDKFLKLYTQDESDKKCIDFISWHDYHQPIKVSSNRQKKVESIIEKYHIEKKLLLFVTEHDPYHFKEDKLEYHTLNTAYLPKSLYFASKFSPDVKFFPWVLFHRKEIQTKFMWFSGPNEVNTRKKEIKMFPLGCSVKFMSMLKGEEIQVKNSIDGNDLVLAAYEEGKIVLETINYGNERDVKINIESISKIFPGLYKEKLHLKKYLIDSNHSNCLTNNRYPGGIEKVDQSKIKIVNDQIQLEHNSLEKNGLVLWVITK